MPFPKLLIPSELCRIFDGFADAKAEIAKLESAPPEQQNRAKICDLTNRINCLLERSGGVPKEIFDNHVPTRVRLSRLRGGNKPVRFSHPAHSPTSNAR